MNEFETKDPSKELKEEKKSPSAWDCIGGNLTKKWNPKMKPYIYKKNRKGRSVLKAQEIIEKLDKAKLKIRELVKSGSTVLFVGISPHLSQIVKEAAINCWSPYMVHRWPGGFLTNSKIIFRRINYLKSLISLQKSEKFTGLSKKSQSDLEKKINKLIKVYGGVIDLKKTPDVIFPIKSSNALKEAVKFRRDYKKMDNISIISICNTDGDPNLADCSILGNDFRERSVSFLVNAVSETIKEIRANDQNNSTEKTSS